MGVSGTAEKGDRRGGQVRPADTDADGRSGLPATAPGENTDDGAVWWPAASTTGTVSTGSWPYGGGSLVARRFRYRRALRYVDRRVSRNPRRSAVPVADRFGTGFVRGVWPEEGGVGTGARWRRCLSGQV
ncbi:hypothetical protein [Streptomyces pimonensis]|uniref:hypothetical protein n=1 Tax=Streptomyces pimonensis TaxID=2860288 RepID=UPI0035272358